MTCVLTSFKFCSYGTATVRAQTHPWLIYEVEGYTEEIVHDFEGRLDTIFNRHVNQVHILDFEGLTEEIREALIGRLRMVYTRAEGQVLFTGHAWRRVFEVQGPLVREFMLEFFSTCRFILALGLHTEEEMALRHNGISGRVQTLEKVTPTYLFYLRSMDEETTVNIPYLLAQYLFRHAEGRKRRARMSEGYFVGRLAEYFGLVSNEGLIGLTMIARQLPVIDMDKLVRLRICDMLGDTWAWVAPRPERQSVVAAGAPKGAEGALTIDEGVQADGEARGGCARVTAKHYRLSGVVDRSITYQSRDASTSAALDAKDQPNL
nr:hypothetical protein [Tanacetum cinerariifolium]